MGQTACKCGKKMSHMEDIGRRLHQHTDPTQYECNMQNQQNTSGIDDVWIPRIPHSRYIQTCDEESIQTELICMETVIDGPPQTQPSKRPLPPLPNTSIYKSSSNIYDSVNGSLKSYQTEYDSDSGLTKFTAPIFPRQRQLLTPGEIEETCPKVVAGHKYTNNHDADTEHRRPDANFTDRSNQNSLRNLHETYSKDELLTNKNEISLGSQANDETELKERCLQSGDETQPKSVINDRDASNDSGLSSGDETDPKILREGQNFLCEIGVLKIEDMNLTLATDEMIDRYEDCNNVKFVTSNWRSSNSSLLQSGEHLQFEPEADTWNALDDIELFDSRGLELYLPVNDSSVTGGLIEDYISCKEKSVFKPPVPTPRGQRLLQNKQDASDKENSIEEDTGTVRKNRYLPLNTRTNDKPYLAITESTNEVLPKANANDPENVRNGKSKPPMPLPRKAIKTETSVNLERDDVISGQTRRKIRYADVVIDGQVCLGHEESRNYNIEDRLAHLENVVDTVTAGFLQQANVIEDTLAKPNNMTRASNQSKRILIVEKTNHKPKSSQTNQDAAGIVEKPEYQLEESIVEETNVDTAGHRLVQMEEKHLHLQGKEDVPQQKDSIMPSEAHSNVIRENHIIQSMLVKEILRMRESDLAQTGNASSGGASTTDYYSSRGIYSARQMNLANERHETYSKRCSNRPASQREYTPPFSYITSYSGNRKSSHNGHTLMKPENFLRPLPLTHVKDDYRACLNISPANVGNNTLRTPKDFDPRLADYDDSAFCSYYPMANLREEE